jgi:hypothetical protein
MLWQTFNAAESINMPVDLPFNDAKEANIGPMTLGMNSEKRVQLSKLGKSLFKSETHNQENNS